jgi:hypothetical protein
MQSGPPLSGASRVVGMGRWEGGASWRQGLSKQAYGEGAPGRPGRQRRRPRRQRRRRRRPGLRWRRWRGKQQQQRRLAQCPLAALPPAQAGRRRTPPSRALPQPLPCPRNLIAALSPPALLDAVAAVAVAVSAAVAATQGVGRQGLGPGRPRKGVEASEGAARGARRRAGGAERERRPGLGGRWRAWSGRGRRPRQPAALACPTQRRTLPLLLQSLLWRRGGAEGALRPDLCPVLHAPPLRGPTACMQHARRPRLLPC